MDKKIDARGLSCPQPVILALNEIRKTKQDSIVVIVDTDTAKENVGRASKSHGWEVDEVQPLEGGYEITIKRGTKNA